MQTITLNRELAGRAVVPMPVPPLPPTAQVPGRRPARPAKAESATRAVTHELDAMLINEPNTGAMAGLKVAFLFNAGLMVAGMVVWEMWSMIAR